MANEALDNDLLGQIMPFTGVPQKADGQGMGGAMPPVQRMQTQYTTAMRVVQPRDISNVTKNVMAESRLAGAAFYYRWEVKNKRTQQKSVVQGGSIDLATCIVRNYGNCAVNVSLVNETPQHYYFEAVFIDLETGLNMNRMFKQRKGQNIGGGMSDARGEDIVFQIGQSKAIRNVILKACPGWMVDKAIEEARAAEIRGIDKEGNIELTRARALEWWAKKGARQVDIERKVGRKFKEMTAEDLADLKASAVAVNEGRITVSELFPTEEEQEAPQQREEKLPEDPPPPKKASSGSNQKPPKESSPKSSEPSRPERGESAPASQPPLQKETAEPPPDPNEEFKKEWIRLGGGNFRSYAEANADRFRGAPEDVRQSAEDKWVRFFGTREPFPWADAEEHVDQQPVDVFDSQQEADDYRGLLIEARKANPEACEEAARDLGFEEWVIPKDRKAQAELLVQIENLTGQKF